MDLSFILSSGSEAAEKFTGDASRAGDSTDEDLETGERDLDDSLMSYNPLTLLTGVLTHLTGVLGRLSGVLDGVSDLLGVVSSLGTGTVDCAAGLAWASGAIPWSIHRCSKVHMDIKSINIAWLIEVGIDGKADCWPPPVKMEASCPPDGIVPAGVPWAAGPSNTTDWWRAGLSESAGSSNWSAEPSVDVCLRDGSSHLADPSPTDPSTAGPSAGPSLARSFPAGSSLAGLSTAGPSITSDGPATAAGPATSTAGSSTWTGWAGEEITVIVLLSGTGNVLETTVLHVWRRTMVRSFQHSLNFSHDDDWAETFGWPMPEMTMITGKCNRLKTCNDGEHERKRPKDGCPSPWKRGWTLNYQSHPLVSWSWTHPKSLDGTAQPLFVCCHVSNMVSGGVLASVGPVSSLPIPTPQSVAFRPIRGGPSHHRDAWSHGLWFTGPRRPGGRFLYLRCPRPRTSGSLCPFRTRGCWHSWKEVEEFLQEHGFWQNCPWSHVLGISVPQPRPCAVSPVHWPWLVLAKPQAANLYRHCMASLLSALRFSRHCWQRKWLPFLLRKCLQPGELQLGFSGRWRAMWSHIRHLVHTGMAWHEDENKLDFVPQATWPNV